MKITITDRNANLKESFKDLVEKKISRLERIFSENATSNVTVTIEKNRETVEITINDNGMIYRAENTSLDMYESLDKVIDSLKRQIRKHKSRLEKKLKSSSLTEFIAEEALLSEEDNDEHEYHVVRSKHFPVKPLNIEEAILQMNMVGHQFYMFKNFETNQMNVVYVRKNGTYGLLEPDVD